MTDASRYEEIITWMDREGDHEIHLPTTAAAERLYLKKRKTPGARRVRWNRILKENPHA